MRRGGDNAVTGGGLSDLLNKYLQFADEPRDPGKGRDKPKVTSRLLIHAPSTSQVLSECQGLSELT